MEASTRGRTNQLHGGLRACDSFKSLTTFSTCMLSSFIFGEFRRQTGYEDPSKDFPETGCEGNRPKVLWAGRAGAFREETEFTPSPSSGNRKCSFKDLIKEFYKFAFQIISEKVLMAV